MKELQTILGTEIPLNTRGILYLCNFSHKNMSIQVVNEKLFEDEGTALMHYANIPNPESQLVTGNTYNDLINQLHTLHKSMNDKQWLKELSECL